MADVDRAAVQEEIKKQGEIVRKLKAEKAGKDKVGSVNTKDLKARKRSTIHVLCKKNNGVSAV